MFGCVCTIAFCVVWWSCVALISCQVCFPSGRRRVVVERSGGEWWRRVSLRSVAEERCRQTNVVEKCWRKYKKLTLLLLAVWASPTNLSIQTWTLKRSGCISHCFAELLSNGDHPGYMTQRHTLDLFNSRSWAASGFLGTVVGTIWSKTPWLWRKRWCFRKGCSSLIFLIIQVIEVKIPWTSRCDDMLPMRPTHDKVLKTRWMLVIDSAWILVYVRCTHTIVCQYLNDICNIEMDIDYIYARKLFA